MNLASWIVLGALAVWAAVALVYVIRHRGAGCCGGGGSASCGGGCGGCSGDCAHCASRCARDRGADNRDA